MDHHVLQAASRTQLQKRAQQLRSAGSVPAVLYGKHIPPRVIQVEAGAFDRIFRAAGESSLIDLTIDKDTPVKVLIHDLQRDAITDAITHIDFYQVDMTQKITAEVDLKFTGVSQAVKELGGVLVENIDAVEIECLPSDLLHEITVDISNLNTFDDVIKVSDLHVPETVTILHTADDVVALVTPPRSEEELKELESEVTEDVEGIGEAEEKKPDEEAEGAEEGAPVEGGDGSSEKPKEKEKE